MNYKRYNTGFGRLEASSSKYARALVGMWVRSNLTDFIVENTNQMNNQDLLIKIEASVNGGIGQQRMEISDILRREYYDTLSFKL
ncbi:hypothetical protein ACPUEK_04720 [Marinomonas gallaica]|uniref:hypothetical protein n=1 Tax=Marinomonas gallaica TaxID=1806667 RepID=UPI003CE45678